MFIFAGFIARITASPNPNKSYADRSLASQGNLKLIQSNWRTGGGLFLNEWSVLLLLVHTIPFTLVSCMFRSNDVCFETPQTGVD